MQPASVKIDISAHFIPDSSLILKGMFCYTEQTVQLYLQTSWNAYWREEHR